MRDKYLVALIALLLALPDDRALRTLLRPMLSAMAAMHAAVRVADACGLNPPAHLGDRAGKYGEFSIHGHG